MLCLNDFKSYGIHTECAEIEKWSILSSKIDNVEQNRKSLPAIRIKLNSREERCLTEYGHLKVRDRPYRGVGV